MTCPLCNGPGRTGRDLHAGTLPCARCWARIQPVLRRNVTVAWRVYRARHRKYGHGARQTRAVLAAYRLRRTEAAASVAT